MNMDFDRISKSISINRKIFIENNSHEFHSRNTYQSQLYIQVAVDVTKQIIVELLFHIHKKIHRLMIQ